MDWAVWSDTTSQDGLKGIGSATLRNLDASWEISGPQGRCI